MNPRGILAKSWPDSIMLTDIFTTPAGAAWALHPYTLIQFPWGIQAAIRGLATHDHTDHNNHTDHTDNTDNTDNIYPNYPNSPAYPVYLTYPYNQNYLKVSLVPPVPTVLLVSTVLPLSSSINCFWFFLAPLTGLPSRL